MDDPTAAAPATTVATAQPEPLLPSDKRTLIAQGAEARVWEGSFCGRPAIVKQRFSKQYRHPALDAKLTAARLKQEVRSMLKARKLGLRVPALYAVEASPQGGAAITMERVAGRSLKAALLSGELGETAVAAAMLEVGRAVALLHDAGVVHGDLTSSNLLMRQGDDALVLIDFGLSYTSSLAEDKAVDLYVLERALLSTHAQQQGLFDQVLTSYKRSSKQWSATFNRFAEVRMRGRKRSMVG